MEGEKVDSFAPLVRCCGVGSELVSICPATVRPGSQTPSQYARPGALVPFCFFLCVFDDSVCEVSIARLASVVTKTKQKKTEISPMGCELWVGGAADEARRAIFVIEDGNSRLECQSAEIDNLRI